MANIQDTSSGKTSPEHFLPTAEKISAVSSKPSVRSKTAAFQFLDLRENGQKLERFWQNPIPCLLYTSIYCASASKMFGVPVVKHGVNGHLRQKGKCAELSCGYGGSVGAMKAFGADAMGLSDNELTQIDVYKRQAVKYLRK